MTSDTKDHSSRGLVTFFQPFYNLRTGELQGVEALARRQASLQDRAELPEALRGGAGDSPADIDRQVLEDALAHMGRWRARQDGRNLVLSVNLSTDFINHPTAVNDLLDAVTRHDMAKDRLLLDVSVDIFRTARGDAEVRGRLKQVQDEEIGLCLDGFTSADLDLMDEAVLAPVDIIKLHPSQPGMGREVLASLVEAIQDRGLPVVAAGVETPEQLELVRELGFEWAQGFHLAEPVDGTAVLEAPTTLPA